MSFRWQIICLDEGKNLKQQPASPVVKKKCRGVEKCDSTGPAVSDSQSPDLKYQITNYQSEGETNANPIH
jgi:hypothetical protein